VLLGRRSDWVVPLFRADWLTRLAADLSVLNGCRRAQGAEYCHGNCRGCLPGTRSSVLNEIESWAKEFDKPPVFWLNGLAGTGESTIARTIGASFFCSRDSEDRSNLQLIFPTLAFQLAYKYPDFRSHLVSLLKSNPGVVDESLYRQMEKLIVEPLAKTGVSTVIVVDALDECKDDEPSSAFLSVNQIPGVKFFLAGRPEPRIKSGFRLPLLVDSTDVFVLHDVLPLLINSDIRLFLKHELSEIARRRRLEGWPSDEHTLELLTTLRPTEGSISLAGPLAYSPDGRSLACSSSTAIIIWDIQTGGVLKEDEGACDSRSLVWSLDGSTVGIIDTASNVHTYEVVSGKTQNLGKLYSGDGGTPFFDQMWAHETSFWAVTVTRHGHTLTINIFEIRRTLVKFHSFTSTENLILPTFSSFSPATFHVCIVFFSTLHIFGDQDSNLLLEVEGKFCFNCFSPDGNLFAASGSVGVHFWKYTSGCYIPWRELRDTRWVLYSLQFSPTLSSILGCSSDVLMVCRLHDLPTTPQTSHPTVAALFDSGNRIAVARQWENTITLLDVHSQNPLQFVDTGVKITHLSVIGNVHLAIGSGKAVA
jgi:WD40 repeat protein